MTSDAGSGSSDRYSLALRRAARRALAEELPLEVAFAVGSFLTGALVENPRRVGKRLDPPLEEQHPARVGDYRVLYSIDEDDRSVTVRSIRHRRDAYRP